MPDFASPFRKGDLRAELPEEFRMGDELIPKAERERRAAERDPVLARAPRVRPLFQGSYDVEPIDPSGKVFPSPVFLVDPKFTKDMKEEEKVIFEGHDLGGYKEPRVGSTWPIIKTQVQKYFHVGPDCTCRN